MEVLSVSGLQTVFMPGGLLIRSTDRWHALLHHPVRGCFLRLPCLHELPGQLAR